MQLHIIWNNSAICIIENPNKSNKTSRQFVCPNFSFYLRVINIKILWNWWNGQKNIYLVLIKVDILNDLLPAAPQVWKPWLQDFWVVSKLPTSTTVSNNSCQCQCHKSKKKKKKPSQYVVQCLLWNIFDNFWCFPSILRSILVGAVLLFSIFCTKLN